MQRGVSMGLTLINQNVSKSHIGCDEIFSVQLTLAAAPSLLEKPCDIILAVNTSDGMGGEALGEIKEMAGRLIRLVAVQTHGGQADHIGAGNRMGPVSYTHLDVYKRQALFNHVCRPGADRGQSGQGAGG